MTNNKKTVDNEPKIIEIQEDTINSPEEMLLKSSRKLLEKYIKSLIASNYMDSVHIKYDPEYQKPKNSKDLAEVGNIICMVKKGSEGLCVAKCSNYRVNDAITIVKKYNNKSGNKDEISCEMSVVTDTGEEINGIELKDKAKYNADAHQGALSAYSNYLQLAIYNPKEFKTYYEKFIGKKLKKTLIQYENSGLIALQQFLGKDFLIDRDKIYYADETGYIPTAYPDVYISANKNRPYQLPRLSKSLKSAQQVCSDFLKNTYDCYGKNGVSALLVIGQIVMGLFFDYFLKKNIGIPLLIICGVSSSGKTTLIQNGIAILGMGDDFLIAGDSTANGQQYIAQSINNVACPVDDVFEAVLNSKSLGAKIKANYKATPKIRMKSYGKEPDLCQICSQLVYTANGNIPQIQELVNRANVISINDTSLDTDNYKYLDENADNREELSLILPELIKYAPEEVFETFEHLKLVLKESLEKVNNRILSNIAYMWTGLTLLQDIAGIKLENIDEGIIEHAKNVAEDYKKLPSPIDLFLEGLVIMKKLGVINPGIHYNIKKPEDTEDGSTLLIFHKETLRTLYNDFFAKDNDRKIDKAIFDRHLKCDTRVVTQEASQRYNQIDSPKKGKNMRSVVLDISDWDEAFEFSGTMVVDTYEPMSYEELSQNVNGCNSL